MKKKVKYGKHLEKGRFYHRSDNQGGHPALLYYKKDKNNLYKALVFTSSKTVGTVPLKKSIDIAYPNKQYYVHTKPFIGKRRDFGRKPLTRLRIKKEDRDLIKALKKWFTDCSFNCVVRESSQSFNHCLHL